MWHGLGEIATRVSVCPFLQRKCEPYWPDSKAEPVLTNRGVQVTLSSIEPFADFEIRTLIVKCVSGSGLVFDLLGPHTTLKWE